MSDSSSLASSSSSSSPSSDTQFERWRKNLSWMTGLGLTLEEEQTRQRDLAQKLDESLLNRCERMKSSLIANSPAVVFMLKHLRLSGCPVSPQHIQCVSCAETETESEAGGFSTDTGGIFISTRGFATRKHMENTMVHELMHMYDHCKFKVDWTNLRHHACSEIRANSLSGDCRWGREINRLFFTFSKQHQVCARRRAVLSVSRNSNCPDEATAERVVNEVWESCFNDTRPFDEIY